MNKLIARASCAYQGDLMDDVVVEMLENEGNYRILEAKHPLYKVEHEVDLDDDEVGDSIVFLVKTKHGGIFETLSKTLRENLLSGNFLASNISFEIGESYGN